MNSTMTPKQAKEFSIAYQNLQRLAQETLECELTIVELLGISSLVEPGASYKILMAHTPETYLEACGIKIQDTGEESDG